MEPGDPMVLPFRSSMLFDVGGFIDQNPEASV